jgi:hypothetical protein
VGFELQRFIREFFALGMVAAGDGALGGGHVGVDGFAGLAHGLIQIGQTNLNA